jgi:hypothetical protein
MDKDTRGALLMSAGLVFAFTFTSLFFGLVFAAGGIWILIKPIPTKGLFKLFTGLLLVGIGILYSVKMIDLALKLSLAVALPLWVLFDEWANVPSSGQEFDVDSGVDDLFSD